MFGIANIFYLTVLISGVRCTHWDEGFDGELLIPVPTPEPAYIIPDYRLGSVPIRPFDLGKSLPRAGLLERQSCNATQTLCTNGYGCCNGACCGSGCCTTAGSTCCGNGTGCCDSGGECCGTVCCINGYSCQNNDCVNPALSSQSVLSVSSVSVEMSLSSESYASASAASVSNEFNSQTRGNTDPNTVNTADVSPSDSRIEYNPASAWVDPATRSGAGLCTNGTKATLTGNSVFSFIFSGSSIALYTVPSTSGGSYSVQIDNGSPAILSNRGTTTQCVVSQAYYKDGLSDQPHKIVVTNGNTGSLEFSGFEYKGRGAWGTSSSGSSSSSSSKKSSNTGAIIGGSVAGAVVLIALIATILFFCFKRRKQATTANNSPPSAKEPMFQQGPGYPQSASPASPQFSQMASTTHNAPYNQTPFTSGHSLVGTGAAAGVAGAGAYGLVSSTPSSGYTNSTGLRYDPPSTWNGQNYSQPYQVQPGQGQGYDQYQGYDRPQSNASGQSMPPIAPLTMMVERPGANPQVSNAGPGFAGFQQYQYNEGLVDPNSNPNPNFHPNPNANHEH